MPPPDRPVPIEGEPELDAAVRAAMTTYLDEVRALVVDGREPSLTAAAVDMRQWPADSAWGALVDRYVRPVVARIYARAYETVADETPPEARTEAWTTGLTRRLTPQTWPLRVWAAVQTAVTTSRARQEAPDLTAARVRDVLRIDAPGLDYRERTATLRATAADEDAPAEQRRAAAADLRGREGPPPDGAGTPWISDAARIAQTETVAATGSGAVEAAQDTYPGATKVWRHRRPDDGHIREAHKDADGQAVPVTDPFVVDTESLMYPGDPSGSPENSINCRCEVQILPAARTPRGEGAMTTTTDSLAAAVTARTDLPFAPRDTPWDGQAAREAVRGWATKDGKLDAARYAEAFLYRPDGAPPSAYQLPFATVRDGHLEAVWKGVSAAAAAVQGSRGGVDLPEAAVKDVKTRLATLYANAAKAFDDDTIRVPWTTSAMRASLVAAGALEQPQPTFAGAVDVWDPEQFADFGGRPGAEAFVRPDWLKGPGTLPTPESIQAEEPFDDMKPRIVVFPDNTLVGYTSTWPSCHVGFPDECVTAPRDVPTGPGQLGYGSFHRFPVQIADGALRLGKVTMVTDKGRPGHAVTTADAVRAAAHYDNAANLMAMVRAGEDEYGIWIAGALLPDVDPADRVKLALSELSGDWRHVNGVPLQMIASLAVNHGGFLASAGNGEAAPAEEVSGGCGCNSEEPPAEDGADSVEDAETPGPLDEDLAALVAAVAVDLDLDDEQLAAIDRDMKVVVAAAAPVAEDQAVTAAGAEAVTAANWVEQTGTGHLPAYIRRIANHLTEQGMDASRAIATAVNVAKRACSNPDGLNFPGVQKVTAQTRAQACRAVTEWEAKKAEARMK
ncbi:phage minor head protein [Streptomyces sp. NPDC088739]|uniref:phage minor head protein n=1 Tax=Streptomyces sp. NPDC088739 TaxID=3365882 RepID=UPI00381F24E3